MLLCCCGSHYHHFIIYNIKLFKQGFCPFCLHPSRMPCIPSRFSRARLCATQWTAADQAPPSTGVSRQEYWNGLPFPSPPSRICAGHVAFMHWSHGYHALIPLLIMPWSRDWTCRGHVAIMHWPRDWSYMSMWLIMHWSHAWSRTDHVPDHALITWLIMHSSPA